MTDIINLNQQRKAKARDEKDKKSAENRRKFGRSKEEKLKEKQAAKKLKTHLDGHKRETDAEE